MVASTPAVAAGLPSIIAFLILLILLEQNASTNPQELSREKIEMNAKVVCLPATYVHILSLQTDDVYT
jgi:hypothetical protein